MSNNIILYICFIVCTFADSNESRSSQNRYDKSLLGCPDLLLCRCGEDGHIEGGFKADCEFSNLSSFPDQFGEHTHWTDIDLSFNNIDSIGKKTFNNIHRVQILKLSYNVISDVNPKSFKMLHSLNGLWLDRNRLSHLPPFLFTESLNIEKLYLSSNFITNLSSDSLKGLQNLKILSLLNNLMSEIPVGGLKHTKKLMVLDLAMNRITFIPNDAFLNLKDLKVLNLRENRISNVGDRAMAPITNCIELFLSYNQLTEYPTTVMDLKMLFRLELNNNEIHRLPDRSFINQIGLEYLTFYNNPLLYIGRWTFITLCNIKSLIITNVTRQVYFPQLPTCNSLQELAVTKGLIQSLPNDLCLANSSLKVLNISENDLYRLKGLENCRNLEVLDVSCNELSSIAIADLRNLTSLKTLDLSNNNIKYLEQDSFKNMKLEKLNLANNPITILPEAGLANLEILMLSNTRNLLYLPSSNALTNLKYLQATYSYHCCQLFAEINAKKLDNADHYVTCFPSPTALTPCRTDLLQAPLLRIPLCLLVVLSISFNIIIILFCLRQNFIIPFSYQKAKRFTNELTEITRLESYENIFAAGIRRKGDNMEAFGLILCHLSLSDLIATFYLTIIVTFDLRNRGRFYEVAAWWQESAYCQSAGFFLVFGIQLCFYTLFIATIERYLTTMFPLNPEKHMKKSVLALAFATAWVLSIATGLVTLYSKNGNSKYYEHSPLPPQNGAMCLPWSTDLSFIASLVSVHLFISAIMIILCALMFCGRRKLSWLSPQKYTRRQLAATVVGNLFCIIPLALIGLFVSVISSYPSVVAPWADSNKRYNSDIKSLNVGVLLAITIFFIVIRFQINPILYTIFSKEFREDFKNLFRTLCLSTTNLLRLNLKKNSMVKRGTQTVDNDIVYYGYISKSSPDLRKELAPLHPTQPYAICQEQVGSQFILSPTLKYFNQSDSSSFAEDNLSNIILRDSEELFYDASNDSSNDEENKSKVQSFACIEQQVEVFENFQGDPFLTSVDQQLLCNSNSCENKNNEKLIAIISKDSEPYGYSTKWTTEFGNKGIETRSLNWKKVQTDQAISSPKTQTNSHSSESSTSKDSGIQSEPDFGTAVPESSASGTLSGADETIQLSKNKTSLFMSPKLQKVLMKQQIHVKDLDSTNFISNSIITKSQENFFCNSLPIIERKTEAIKQETVL